MENQNTISLLVKDHPGVMQRITSLFTRRGYNMESITVGASEETGLSRITIVTACDESQADQIIFQLQKLVEVVEATLLRPRKTVTRELALMKMNVEPNRYSEIFKLVERIHVTVLDIGSKTMIIQAVGDTERINEIVEQLTPYGIFQLSRTGVMAMEK
ncbi:acetolactate synthase small subunit [Bacillus benzoevorans]|uniref:Acetolactate synthase small subunit n=1 Tax=Bacillus benzoevorans TaxID=1456 RepID=A0A7X0HWG2_9BACI|nr:acetolactate synthase small subunit [Bacillus benzoevorans]MBB6448006.1 acetolactate synthase-1/3 small subunit [Bacillus benzoevorans]